MPSATGHPCRSAPVGHDSRIVDLPISACLLELPCQKKVISNSPDTPPRFWLLPKRDMMDLGTSFMTEEKARHYAKVLSRGMGVTFHAVRSREGRFLAVQIPSDDCEILATIRPPRGVNGTRPSAASNSEGLLNVIAGESAGSTALRPRWRARSCRAR